MGLKPQKLVEDADERLMAQPCLHPISPRFTASSAPAGSPIAPNLPHVAPSG